MFVAEKWLMSFTPVSWGRTGVVGSDPVMGRLLLHNYVVPKFLPYQWTGYSTCQTIKYGHHEKDNDYGHPNSTMNSNIV